MALAFISYRHADTAEVAQALYLQLQREFGSGQLFMDVHSIGRSDQISPRVLNALERATVFIPLIGSQWASVTGADGTPRLHDPKDLVRQEAATALKRGIPVVQTLIGQALSPPKEEDLPEDLRPMLDMKASLIRDTAAFWHDDMEQLARTLKRLGLRQRPDKEAPPLPHPKIVALPTLTEQNLLDAMPSIEGWEPWEDTLPEDYPTPRVELVRTFEFSSFAQAVEFMTYLAPRFDRLGHHPRWTNSWRRVTIRLTTWDKQNVLTELDVSTAAEVNKAYKEYLAQLRG